jgi:phage-related minor tail protein
MIRDWIDKIFDTISSINKGLRSIANWFDDVADGAADIPIVGGVLAGFFRGISGLFDTLANLTYDINSAVVHIFGTIASWLEDLADLWSDVYGWIADKIDDAYNWARDAWDLVQEMFNDVSELMYQVFTSIPGKFSSLWDRVNELLDQVFGSIPDLFSSVWDQITEVIHEVFTNIPAFLSTIVGWFFHLSEQVNIWVAGQLSDIWDRITDLPGLIKEEILQFIAPAFNLVSFFFEDISDFFSDPAEYFSKKVDKSEPSFAERLWGVIEKILERIW